MECSSISLTDDAHATAILRACTAAMREGARVLVVERVLRPANEPDPAKFHDLLMLALPGGCERTAAEFEALYAGAGLRLARILPTGSPFSIIEGVRG